MFGIFMADITGDGTGKPWKPWRKATTVGYWNIPSGKLP